MNVFAFSHRRAEQLIDDRLDEERGQGRLEARDAEWLDEHLRSCDACRSFEGDRRKLFAATATLKSTSAPEGFAARVLAAKARGAEPMVGERATNPLARFAIGGAIAAAVLAGFIGVGAISSKSSDTPGGVGISGTGLEQVEATAHFVVRAPGLGPAKARAQAVAIIEAHGGTYQVANGAIFARVPRDELVRVMRDLSKQSQYKVARADAGELEASLTEVVIKFELE